MPSLYTYAHVRAIIGVDCDSRVCDIRCKSTWRIEGQYPQLYRCIADDTTEAPHQNTLTEACHDLLYLKTIIYEVSSLYFVYSDRCG